MFDVRILLLVVVWLANAKPGANIANNLSEKFLVDMKLLEMDLLDKCEDIANIKHQYYTLLNNNRTNAKYFERKFSQFQSANIEMNRLIATSASEIRKNYEYSSIDNKSQENRLMRTLVDIRESSEPDSLQRHRQQQRGQKLRQFLERKYYDFRTRGELERILAGGRRQSTAVDLKIALNNYNRDFVHELDAVTNNSLDSYANWDDVSSSGTKFDVDFLSFEQLNSTWNEIAFLYDDLLKFVKLRISQKYRFVFANADQPVPAYLLGTILGDDWTNLFEFVLPYPDYVDRNLFAAIENNRTIDNLLKEIALNSSLEIELIDNYDTCPVDLLNYCRTATTKLTICKRLRVSDYFDLFEKNIENVLVKSDRNYGLAVAIASATTARTRIPIFSEMASIANDFNALDAIVGRNRRSDRSNTLEAKMMRKLLLALRTLPKLAYYQFVEKWRMEIRTRNASGAAAAAAEPITLLWSRLRSHEQHIDDSSATFLFDPNIFLNRPYSGKFFATIMQFQLLEARHNDDDDDDDATGSSDFRLPADTLPLLIKKVFENNNNVDDGGSMTDDREHLSRNQSLNELSVSAIVQYFRPVFAYLHNLSNNLPEFYENEQLMTTTTTAATTIASNLETTSVETMETANGTVSVLASVIATDSKNGQVPRPQSNAIDTLLEFKVAFCAFLVTFVTCFLLIFLLIFLRRICCRCCKKTKFAKNRRFS